MDGPFTNADLTPSLQPTAETKLSLNAALDALLLTLPTALLGLSPDAPTPQPSLELVAELSSLLSALQDLVQHQLLTQHLLLSLSQDLHQLLSQHQLLETTFLLDLNQ
jgi:hypothetical protein